MTYPKAIIIAAAILGGAILIAGLDFPSTAASTDVYANEVYGLDGFVRNVVQGVVQGCQVYGTVTGEVYLYSENYGEIESASLNAWLSC